MRLSIVFAGSGVNGNVDDANAGNVFIPSMGYRATVLQDCRAAGSQGCEGLRAEHGTVQMGATAGATATDSVQPVGAMPIPYPPGRSGEVGPSRALAAWL